jgi:hypothetical protein
MQYDKVAAVPLRGFEREHVVEGDHLAGRRERTGIAGAPQETRSRVERENSLLPQMASPATQGSPRLAHFDMRSQAGGDFLGVSLDPGDFVRTEACVHVNFHYQLMFLLQALIVSRLFQNFQNVRSDKCSE